METLESECGNYAIVHRKDGTGMAQIFEYSGFAPRVELRRAEVPLSLLKSLFSLGTLKEIPQPLPAASN